MRVEIPPWLLWGHVNVATEPNVGAIQRRKLNAFYHKNEGKSVLLPSLVGVYRRTLPASHERGFSSRGARLLVRPFNFGWGRDDSA